METRVNSFTETVDQLVNNVNIAMENVVKLNDSITTQYDSVTLSVDQIDPITGDSSTVTYTLPSYNNVINKVNAMSQTVDVFVRGEGVILLNDGTYRKVSTMPVAISPSTITGVTAPSTFTTRSNWFFESLLFPQLIVSFNLKNKIDDRSDRVVVKRIIFDNPNDTETQWFLDNIIGTERSYYDIITYLNANNKKYWEDEEVQNLPLATEPYTGYFVITDKRTINAKEWYYIDTVKYGVTSDEPVVKDQQLSIGDKLRYNNSIWTINDINTSELRVQLVPTVGTDHPTINKSFEIYTEPFSTKTLNIPVGYNECNIIFIKGVNDDFNIISDDWGYGITFYSNNLTISGGTTTLEDYYVENVADFGKQMEGQAKEKFVPAYFGVIPDAPVITADQFGVDQINTQLNAALDTNEVKNTQTQIESTKTVVDSLKTTIAQQKAELVEITDSAQREDLNSKISVNVSQLAKRTTEYQSLVRSLATLAYENDNVKAEGKYRARGFFEIPTEKFANGYNQEIIQFEIAYRYLRLDGTGNPLKMHSYDDPSTGDKRRGTYSDWIIVQTPIKERIWDASLNRYKWIHPNIADGNEVNINQIDIPIRKGEKVEFKIRSISEAGWPANPLKSAWSTPVIKEFPSNLSGSDQVTKILEDAVVEETNIKLSETLSATGVDTHLADSIPNPTAGDGTYFKHQAVNLAFDLSQKDIGGIISSTSTTDLQTQLANIPLRTFTTITQPAGAVSAYPQLTGTIQQFFQAIVNIDPSIYEEFQSIITT